MTVRANHLTLARVVLLPLPVALLYHGVWGRMIALALFALLGITDYLDGVLARRQGATPLGRLLDPIADKIFIAAMVVPLMDQGVLPVWMGWLILFREFLVTELRRAMSEQGLRLPVVELAKVKTTLQMTGLGLMVMTAAFPGKEVTIAFLSGALVATAILAMAVYVRFGEFTFRTRAALGFMGAGLMVALLLPPSQVNLVYGGVIVAITLWTGLGYGLKGMGAAMKRGGLLLSTMVTPLLPLALFSRFSTQERFILLGLLCWEFGVQGMETWIRQQGRGAPSTVTAWAKGAVATASFGAVLLSRGAFSPSWALILTCAAALVHGAWSMVTSRRGR